MGGVKSRAGEGDGHHESRFFFFFLLLKETQGTRRLKKVQTVLLTPVCLTHTPAPRYSIC